MRISKKEFEACVGFKPENDDLKRSNCNKAGQIGHLTCGWCLLHQKPEFICACRVRKLAQVPLDANPHWKC